MKDKKDKYFEAQLNDVEEQEFKKETIKEDSAEGEMLRALNDFKTSTSYPVNEEKVSGLKRFLIAASISLVIVSAVLYISHVSDNDKLLSDSNWGGYSIFEKLHYINTVETDKLNQKLAWKWYKTEKNVNVRIALLRVLDGQTIDRLEFERIIESEESPLARGTLVALKD